MSAHVARIALPDGTWVWARITGIEEVADRGASTVGSYVDTGMADRVTARMESLRDLITGVAGSLADGVRDARPDEVSVTFGVELTGRAGKVIGLLADGAAKSSLTVTLTWRGGPPSQGASGA